MCGVVGIVSARRANQDLYDELTVLQHRGQDSAGIATNEGNHLYWRRSNGLVWDVFHQGHMLALRGHLGIGHVRYPTAGFYSSSEAQPFYVNSPYGIALGHNGNLINADDLFNWWKCQHGLASTASEGVSFHRNAGQDVQRDGATHSAPDSMSELPMRHMMHAWRDYMTAGKGA